MHSEPYFNSSGYTRHIIRIVFMQAAEHRPTVKLVNIVQWFTHPAVNITGDQSPETVVTFACFYSFKYVIILISSN